MTAWLEFALACGIVAGWGLTVYGGTYLIGALIDRGVDRLWPEDTPSDWLDQ